MISAIIALGAVFFSDVLFLGKIFFAGDNLTINAPAKALFFNMLAYGQLPLWNPFVFSGTPFLADINLGLLSPLNVFYLFLSPLKALSFSIVFAVILCGIGMFLFARALKLSPFASLISAIVFMFSGTIMTHTMNTAILNTIVWLPFLFASIKRLIETKKIKYSLFSTILLTLAFYGGHIQYFYYIVLFSLIYILCQSVTGKEKIKIIAYIYIPVLFLSAIQLLPFLEYAQFSTRPTNSLSYAGSVTPVSFIHLILPNFFGIMKDGTSWGATADINGYAGIIPFFLTIWVILKKRSREVTFFGLSALITLLIALGKYSPVYLICFYVLPFFARFRSPTSIMILYTFALAVLTGYGSHYLIELNNLKIKAWKLLILIFSSILLVSISIYLRFSAFDKFVSLMHWLQQIKKTAFITRFLEYAPSRMTIIFHLWMDNISIVFLIIFLLGIFLYVLKKQGNNTYAQFIFILLIASEVMFFAGNNYIVSTQSKLQTPTAITNFFKRDASNYRTLTLNDPGAKPPFADPSYFENEGIKAMDYLQQNVNIFESVQSITGYASIVPNYYASYLNSKNDDPTGITLPKPGMEQLDELGVKYILTAGRYEKELSENEKMRLVYTYSDPRIKRTFHMYENLKYYPRAYLADKNNAVIKSAAITSYKPNEIKVSVDAPENARLILSEMYYPGWTVTVDGKKTEISQYKVFRAVSVEKGKHLIVFKYLPALFIIGALLSLFNWIYILIFLGIVLFKEHQKVSQPLHIGKPKVKKNA